MKSYGVEVEECKDWYGKAPCMTRSGGVDRDTDLGLILRYIFW
jgi:hypothetical protein